MFILTTVSWLYDLVVILLSPQPDRTYDLKIGQPTVSYFLKQAAGIAKGASKTGEMGWCTDASALTPVWVLPVTDTRLSLGSWAWLWLMLYSWHAGKLQQSKEVVMVLRKENDGLVPQSYEAFSSLVSVIES